MEKQDKRPMPMHAVMSFETYINTARVRGAWTRWVGLRQFFYKLDFVTELEDFRKHKEFLFAQMKDAIHRTVAVIADGASAPCKPMPMLLLTSPGHETLRGAPDGWTCKGGIACPPEPKVEFDPKALRRDDVVTIAGGEGRVHRMGFDGSVDRIDSTMVWWGEGRWNGCWTSFRDVVNDAIAVNGMPIAEWVATVQPSRLAPDLCEAKHVPSSDASYSNRLSTQDSIRPISLTDDEIAKEMEAHSREWQERERRHIDAIKRSMMQPLSLTRTGLCILGK